MLRCSAASGKSILTAFVLLVLCVTFALPVSAYALDESQVTFELKFLLDSDKVLTDEHLLTEDMRTLIGAEPEYRTISAIYLETGDRAFDREGWVNRIRWKENKKKIECTYRKRYPLSGEDAQAIRAALARAAADGFTFSESAYSAQIDWGYSKMTLSVTMETSAKHARHQSLDEFSTGDAIAFFKKTMPDEERDWREKQWGASMLDQAQKLGPLRYRRVKGNWQGAELQVDIFPIGDRYTTELSFEAVGLETASALREQMKKLLDEKGVLLHEDSLKTQMILDSYLRSWPPEPDTIPPQPAAQIKESSSVRTGR